MKELLAAIMSETLVVPTYEALALLLLLVLSLLFRTIRLGILVAYLFALRLCWVFFFDYWGEEGMQYLYVFSIIGLVIFLLSLWRMWDESNS